MTTNTELHELIGQLRSFSRSTVNNPNEPAREYLQSLVDRLPSAASQLIERNEVLEEALDEIAHASWPSVNGDDPVKRIKGVALRSLQEVRQND